MAMAIMNDHLDPSSSEDEGDGEDWRGVGDEADGALTEYE